MTDQKETQMSELQILRIAEIRTQTSSNHLDAMFDGAPTEEQNITATVKTTLYATHLCKSNPRMIARIVSLANHMRVEMT